MRTSPTTSRPAQLASLEQRDLPTPNRGLALLCLFIGVTAIAGGIGLVVAPRGSSIAPLAILDNSPFASFLVPGLVLLAVVGTSNTAVGILMLWRPGRFRQLAVGSGGVLLIWIVTQMVMLRTINALQLIYLGAALVIIVRGATLHARDGASER